MHVLGRGGAVDKQDEDKERKYDRIVQTEPSEKRSEGGQSM